MSYIRQFFFAAFLLAAPVAMHASTAITDCTGLQNMANDLDGEYVLADDIDCTGIDFEPVGRDGANFTGTFNGSGYTISNLTVYVGTGAGLFGYARNAVIENVVIDEATIHGDDEGADGGVGALIGTAAFTNVRNVGVTNSMITHSGSFVGGLVGYSALLTVTGAYVTDTTIIGREDGVGGLAGAILSGVIADSYADAVVIGGGDYTGGAVGFLWSIAGPASLKNVYASGTLLALGDFGGGLVGVMQYNTGVCTVENSFAVGNVDGPSTAGLVAMKMSEECSIINSAYLNHDLSPDICIGLDDGGTTECTEIPAPAYFYTQDYEPMASWDFETAWYERENDFPELRWTNADPSPPMSVSASVNGDDITLSWTDPVDADFAGVTIVRSTTGFPADISDGTSVATGETDGSFTDSSLSPGAYYYSLFALDEIDNVSEAATVSATAVAVSSSSSSSSSSESPARTPSGGGSRGGSTRMIVDTLKERMTNFFTPHAAPPSIVAQESTTKTMEVRTCDRVMKWFRGNETMLGRVNTRLEKRFGFTCNN